MYKKTLNLPRTDFAMKANLAQREPEIVRRWTETRVYERLLAHNADRPRFVLHDGPPYANGHIHLGTTLNKVLKDIIVKHRAMLGHSAPYVPGWDCHGLPIELEVERELGRARKETLPKNQVRQWCREYAARFVAVQRAEFERLGVLGDWEHPYLTMDPAYVAEDRAAALHEAKRMLARYANLPFYGNMLAASGFAAEVDAVRAAWQRRDVAAAEGAVTDEMADAVTLAGEPARCRERLAAYRSAGATLPIVFPNPVGESRAAAVERTLASLAPH